MSTTVSIGIERSTAAVRPGRRLDPRTKLGLLTLISIAVLSANGSVWILPSVIMVGALLAVARRWRRLLIFLSLVGVGLVITRVLPLLGDHVVVGVFVVSFGYLLRLVVVAGMAGYLAATTGASELTAALRAMHAPRAITVSFAVMVRFLPTVISEARAVRDAMRLRGLGREPIGMLRSPVATLERFVVPMIASCLRVAEDLSASALLRGLGSHRRPTAMQPPRFGRYDLLILVLTVVLVAGTFRLVRP